LGDQLAAKDIFEVSARACAPVTVRTLAICAKVTDNSEAPEGLPDQAMKRLAIAAAAFDPVSSYDAGHNTARDTSRLCDVTIGQTTEIKVDDLLVPTMTVGLFVGLCYTVSHRLTSSDNETPEALRRLPFRLRVSTRSTQQGTGRTQGEGTHPPATGQNSTLLTVGMAARRMASRNLSTIPVDHQPS
jgi:hypothetical protein